MKMETSLDGMVAQVSSRKYRIERYLAEGGMGAIYVGKKLGPEGFEKEVVLKQLLPEFTSRPEFRDLFFREAKISATLDHQNIVRTFDLVKTSDRLFIVMEYVRGADLRTIAWRARRRKALSVKAILHVAIEILSGLGYAHSRRSSKGEPLGIIHRDLSPSNILCSGEGEVKLSDFGIAKAATYSSVFYRVRGKVGYMSPEMARNQPLDARSDLFSLGVSIYETLIGERLYSGDLNTPPDTIYAQQIPPLAAKCPDLPPELQGVFDRALALDREDRYPNAEAFSEAIRQVMLPYGLLYSAPEFASELREIMGPNSANWLSEERDLTATQSASGDEVPGNLAGKDASSLVESGVSELPPDPIYPDGQATVLENPGANARSFERKLGASETEGEMDQGVASSSQTTQSVVLASDTIPTPPVQKPFLEPAYSPTIQETGLMMRPREWSKTRWLVLLATAIVFGFVVTRFFFLSP
jgi:serine/threonine protein kinase